MKIVFIFVIVLFMLTNCESKTNKTKQLILRDTIVNTIDSKEDIHYITKAFVLGKFDYKNDSLFLKVHEDYSTKIIYLNKEVYQSFKAMADAAKLKSIDLKIISGTRNFYEQKAIWERKWKRYESLEPIERVKKILEYSAMPSSSRHHWGTDIDINSLNNSYFNSGKGLTEYNWLKTHANNFGFYQVYTEKNNGRTGYNLEKWHWSYLPLASKYLKYYNANLAIGDIMGFEGADYADQLNIIEYYVNGISKSALNYEQK